jgi:pimeloyl-ACP methyl ester carboxylesterase
MTAAQTITTSGGPIAYREFGPADADPLLFVHGLLVDGRLWDGVAERLSDRYRCIVPDWPMGSHKLAMNPDADLAPPAVAELVAEFIGSLGLERVTVIGNDSGGAVSQMLTAAHPDLVERLILTNCDTLEHFPPFPFSLMPPIARIPGGMTALALPFRLGPVARFTYGQFTTRPVAQELISDWLKPAFTDKAVRRDGAKLTAGASKRQTLAAAEGLRSFPRPVRFVWGVDDRYFKLEHAHRLAAMVPDAEITEVADAKTFSPLDQPQAVADGIAAYVREPVPA